MSKTDIKKAGVALFDKVKELSDSYDITLSEMNRFEAAVPYCRGLLEACGFKVTSPMTYKYNDIDKLDLLVDFFYNSFTRLYPKKITPVRNDGRDRKTAKMLIEAIAAAGELTKRHAMAESAKVIEVVLSNPDVFPLVFSIGFRMFGQGDMVWVTEKALAIINEERTYQTSEYFEKLNNMCNETYEGEVGFNLDELEENDNGKKETAG
jgi:hypothetical protein